MEILKSGTLSNLIERCDNYKGYKAAIVFANQAQRNMFLDSMRDMNALGDALWKVDKRIGGARFNNGSVIKALVYSEQSKGQRFHEILFDRAVAVSEISEDVVYKIYGRCLMPYIVGDEYSDENSETKISGKMNYKDPDVDLDDFLGTFTIT